MPKGKAPRARPSRQDRSGAGRTHRPPSAWRSIISFVSSRSIAEQVIAGVIAGVLLLVIGTVVTKNLQGSGSVSTPPPSSSASPSLAPTSSRPATSTLTKASACNALRRTATTEAQALGALQASINGDHARGTVTLSESKKTAFQDARRQVDAALTASQAALVAFQDLGGELLPTKPEEEDIQKFPDDLAQMQSELPGFYSTLRPGAVSHSGYDAWNQLTDWTAHAGYVARMRCPLA